MEMYLNLIQGKIDEISSIIISVDGVAPNNETQGEYKKQILNYLMDVRRCWREVYDHMEIYLRR